MMVDLQAVRAAAGSTPDPEIRVSIGELGLLDDVEIDGAHVTVHYHLTSPLCPLVFATKIGREIRRRVVRVPGVATCRVVIQDHFMWEEIQHKVNCGTCGSTHGQAALPLEAAR